MPEKKRVSCPELTAQLDNLAKLLDSITDVQIARDLAYCIGVTIDEFGKHAGKKGKPVSTPAAAIKPAAKKKVASDDLFDESNEDGGMTQEEIEELDKLVKKSKQRDPAEADLEKILRNLAKGRTKGGK